MPGQEPIHLFVYGTLTDPERIVALTGKQFEQVEARLSGFERVNSPLGYPFILPSPGAIVHGVLLLNIDPVSLVQLYAYEDEGHLYRRQAVAVEVAGQRICAVTYVGHGICATVAEMAVRGTDPRHLQDDPRASAPAGHGQAPLADEH
jgi:gamma-glutamylcyclotransferase (GGCT)/AIG2-like uncharacterized protein YtfP